MLFSRTCRNSLDAWHTVHRPIRLYQMRRKPFGFGLTRLVNSEIQSRNPKGVVSFMRSAPNKPLKRTPRETPELISGFCTARGRLA